MGGKPARYHQPKTRIQVISGMVRHLAILNKMRTNASNNPFCRTFFCLDLCSQLLPSLQAAGVSKTLEYWDKMLRSRIFICRWIRLLEWGYPFFIKPIDHYLTI